ncbi:MAG TPA: thioredoxin family protein [Candidatus Nanoarchaeia archaeon]|nr:thioredoxin family protein [Candidatus Nanoarchaeia archaeon]
MVLLKSEQKLKIGDKAPDFCLKGVDDKVYSLKDFKNEKALLVVFMCNHCPYVKAKFEVIKGIASKYKDRGLVVVGINSNESINYPDDSFENMKKAAKEKKFNFAYLYDETQETAKDYGAVCTPDPFLFDSNMKLVYHGRLDNAMSPGETATSHDMDDAVDALLKGRPISKGFLPSQGCSIKWKD